MITKKLSPFFKIQVKKKKNYLNGFYNILCWWKIEGDFLLTLFLRFNSKRDSLLVKFSRPKRHPT
ncbi:hypothetical protein, partial [Enterococcus gallinarum]|uniref:hypothetical protein n=1 Tax=Enterococcus gallinarum TaxID=1353 RepID=UPI0035D5BAA7